jgi:hypothetical protein
MAMIGVPMTTIVPVIENVRHEAADQAFSSCPYDGGSAHAFTGGDFILITYHNGSDHFVSALALTSASDNFLSCYESGYNFSQS